MISLYLLAVIVASYILQLVIPGYTDAFIFNPSLVATEPWRMVTNIFLHGDITHLFFNGYALFLFGIILERKVTQKQYLTLFFGAGIVGNILYYAGILGGIIPPSLALGASGAVYGILGAVAVMFPNLRIWMMFIPMTMRTAAIFWAVISLMGTFDTTSNIGYAAHLGGLIFGWGYAKNLQKRQEEHTWSDVVYQEDPFAPPKEGFM